MATIHLYNDNLGSDTIVPNIFIDNYMPEANGEFVKVFLYLLRCINSNSCDFSISTIADRFDHTEKDVLRALKYWERQKLIQLEYDSSKALTGIHFKKMEELSNDDYAANVNAIPASSIANEVTANSISNTAGSVTSTTNSVPVTTNSIPAATTNVPVTVEAAPAADIATTIKQADKRPQYTLDQMKEFHKDPAITELFFIIETYVKHTLSEADSNTILYWYSELGFGTDLIEYLVEYCITKGHSSMRYMDKVALGWAENGIKTIDQAKEYAVMRTKVYYAVMKALGISGRSLVDNEISYLNKWSKDYAFDMEIIQEACKRTITATHQPSFEYTDSILTNWHKNNVHTLKDIQKLDDAFTKSKKITIKTNDATDSIKRNKFNNFNQRKYDSSEIERVLLTTSVQ